MRKSLDTRIIDNLNKRRPIEKPSYIRHTLTENDIDRIVYRRSITDGRKVYDIFVKNIYTGINDIGPYLEEHFNIEELGQINIILYSVPNFYLSIIARNELGDDLFLDYDIAANLKYYDSGELPAQTMLDSGSLNSTWFITNLETYLINFNGVWIIGETIWEAE